MPRARHAALSALLMLASGPAAAQVPAPERPPAPRTDLDGKPGALSDKLGQTNGVIKPEGDVDPAMRKAPPAAGTMPVIKPGSVAPGTAK